METRKVVWNEKAFSALQTIIYWYLHNMGESAAIKVANSFDKTVALIAQSPAIGTIDPRYAHSKMNYRSILVHPNHRILYRYTKSTLRIILVVCNRMNNQEL